MNFKETLLNLFISLLVSPIIVYIFIALAGMAGSKYEMSHGDTFIIWLLMAIVINLSIVKKD